MDLPPEQPSFHGMRLALPGGMRTSANPAHLLSLPLVAILGLAFGACMAPTGSSYDGIDPFDRKIGA